MENIKIKKRQFVVIQFKEEDLKIENNEVIATLNKKSYVQTSATTLLRQLEKIEKKNNINRSIEDFNKEMKELGIKEFNVDAYIKLVSIEFEKATEGNAELIEKCINEGFKIKNTKMKFLGAVGGSHVKNVKQFYVREDIHAEVEKKVNLKDLKYCIIPKRLTSNALLTTSIWEIPYKLDMLNVCILPDNEIERAFPNKLETLTPYTYNEFTDEEKAKYANFEEYKSMKESYKKVKKEYKDKIKDIKNLSLKLEHTLYKTPSRWLSEDNRLVMLEEVENPLYKNAKERVIYGKNQTRKLEHNIFEVAEWSLGYRVTDYNEKLSVNNFDGFGICSLELGNYIRSYLNDYYINGFQLRIPQQKGFYSIVDFKSYCREHGIEYLYDMFGYKWLVENIDILTTESTFKAKIETDETGKSKKWMWESYQEYQSTVVSQCHDCIGIANYTHTRHENEYRALTYQLLESLNATEFDLLSLANEHGKMLYKVISIYRENREKGQEINWEDIKYIKCYLQSLLGEKGATEDDYVVTALKCIDLNKYMIFDKKFTTFLAREIERELNQLSLGQIKVKSNYLYITTDILGFLKYASQFGTEEAKDSDCRKKLSETEIEGILKEGQFYCEGVTGKKLMVRNPLMAQSEIIKAEYVDLSHLNDYKYIKHLNNILQSPMNTYCFQQSTFDVDGDKFHLIHLDHNLKEYNLEWLVNYDFIPEVINSTSDEDLKIELTNLDILKQKIDLYYRVAFKNQEVVTLADLIDNNHKIIVNPSDGTTVAGEEWNTTNIHNFLVNSDDKTGIITDFNTVALNQLNGLSLQDYFASQFQDIYETNKIEDKFRDYKWSSLKDWDAVDLAKEPLKLTNKYCKFFQGVIIDMSKRGGTVEIAEILSLVYNKKPQFYKMKGVEDNKLDKDVKSHMDRFYKKMQSLNRTAGKLFTAKVRENISNHELYFTPRLIQDSRINHTEYLNKIKELLKPLIKNYQEEMQKLVDEKKNINKFSKNDEHKNARLESKRKFKELAIKTVEEAKKHCPNDLVLAQALYSHVYNSDDSKAFSYAWTVAEKGFIYNIQSNQTEKYNVELAITSSDTDIFEYFGKKYKLTITDNKIEYYKREDLMLNKLEEFMVDTDVERVEDAKLKFIANAPHYKEDKENYVENLLQNITVKEFMLKEKNGFVQLADLEGNILIGINSKELDYSEIDIPNKDSYKIKFKEIERSYNKDKKLNKTGFIATVDIYK